MRILLLLFLTMGVYAREPLLIYYGSALPESALARYETVVLEPDHYADVSKIDSNVFAYLSVGEVHKHRPYFQKLSEAGLLGKNNPDWPDARYVSLKNDTFEKILCEQVIPDLIRRGYKGLFLDTLDSFAVSQVSHSEVLDFLKAIRKASSGIKLMFNRGFAYVKDFIPDSILLESTISTYDFSQKQHRMLASPETHPVPSEVKKFSLDYWDYTDPKRHLEIYAKAKELGYLPLVSHISLMMEPLVLASDQSAPKAKALKRQLVAIYDSRLGQDSELNPIQQYLEMPLNYLGYHCRYFDQADLDRIPRDADTYLLWQTTQNPMQAEKFVELVLQLLQMKKRILWFGQVPRVEKMELQTRLHQALGFEIGGFFADGSSATRIESAVFSEGFEVEYNPMTMGSFEEMTISSQTLPWLTVANQSRLSYPILKTGFGLYAMDDWVMHRDESNHTYWFVDPIELLSQVLPALPLIPDPATYKGKRAQIIHLDGDGAHSFSEVMPGHYNAEVLLEKVLKQYPMPHGVSLIGFEIDKAYRGTQRLQAAAREIFHLPHVETATHTYSHPYSWSSGLVAFSVQKAAVPADYRGIPAFLEPEGEINLRFEVDQSIEFLNQFTPEEKGIQVLYWSGDCKPNYRALKWLEDRNILAMNGGDTRLDQEYDSLSNVKPLGRDVRGLRQIYSPNSNENTYTELWTDRFGNFARVLETFARTESPRRLKPVNLYYHFYAVEKSESYASLIKVYQWLSEQQSELEPMLPSAYIKAAREFYSQGIVALGRGFYQVKGIENLRDFRLKAKSLVGASSAVRLGVHHKSQSEYLYLPDGEDLIVQIGDM